MDSEGVLALAAEVDELVAIAHNNWLKLKNSDYSADMIQDDLRITTFVKLANVLEATSTVNLLLAKSGMKKEFWEDQYENIPQITQENIQVRLLSTATFNFQYSFVAFFSVYESCLRCFIRSLSPEAHAGGTGNIKAICEDLMRRTELNSSDNIALLDLARNIRNTMHNDGVFLHPTQSEIIIEWEQREYKFVESTTPSFITWEFTLEVFEGLLNLMWDMVNADSLRSVNGRIDNLIPFRDVDV